MKFDIVTIFPQFFEVLDVSLIGKARESGIMEVAVHDLRDWSTDKHRSVDDTPLGGGAGMLMRPDVWGRAIDDLRGKNTVVMMPTPSGRPLTQQWVQEIADSGRDLLIGCGRYEGIDARVFDEYEVVEYSIGDYVVNGGEVAALVLLEAVGRLLDGTVGNPESLVEESHGAAGLLEYPCFTRPRSWRGREVPEVLFGGNHALIERWRRNQALSRTAARRPDMLAKLDSRDLDWMDREVLADAGMVVYPRPARVRFRLATLDDAEAVSQLAMRLFPSACPAEIPDTAIEDFIAVELSSGCFADMLADYLRYRVFLAQVCLSNAPVERWESVGYTLIINHGSRGAPPVDEVGEDFAPGAAYLSKCYLDEKWHGSGISGALLERALRDLLEVEPKTRRILLGTNTGNRRAGKFYKRHGFRRVSRRVFYVGGVPNNDVVMCRELV